MGQIDLFHNQSFLWDHVKKLTLKKNLNYNKDVNLN